MTFSSRIPVHLTGPAIVALLQVNCDSAGVGVCRCNVDMLKLIQLGMTFVDAEGNLPSCSGELCVWQFNFRLDGKLDGGRKAAVSSCCCSLLQELSQLASCREFKLSDDMYAQDSIELLKQSGIDFFQNEKRGIDVSQFGELLMTSGIVLNDEVRDLCLYLLYVLQRSFAVRRSSCCCMASCSADRLEPCIRCVGLLSIAVMTLATSSKC